MADYQAIIDEIRGVLLSADATATERDAPLARVYAQACAEVNTRLAKCQKLLSQGLRAEALHSAKVPVDLVESVETVFYFPSREEWIERVDVYALTSPQGLDEDAFTALQEAFADEAPLQGLLRKHRRLALARAALPERIAVLRELARQDAANPIWSDDVTIFEGVRIEQIRHESSRAKADRDSATLGRLASELSAMGWSVAVPQNVLSEVRRSLGQFRTEDARRELAFIEGELNDAHSAFDYDRGRAARARWLATLVPASLPPSDRLRERAEPALEWLAKRDRDDQDDVAHREAVGMLEALLDDRAPRAEVERAYQAVARFDRGMPSVLHTRTQARLREIEIHESRGRRLVLTCSVLGIVVVGSLGGWIFHQHGRSREAQLVGDVIVKALDEGRIEEAVKAEEDARKHDPALLARGETADARARLARALEAETQRLAEFKSLLDDASSAPIAKKPPESLIKARGLARGDAEMASLQRLEASRGRNFEAQVTKNTAELLPRYQAVLTTIAALREAIYRSEDHDQIGKKVAEALSAKPDLVDDPDFYSAELLRTQTAVRDLAKEVNDEVAVRRREHALGEEVVRNVRNLASEPTAYKAALETVANDKTLATRARTRDFQRVLREEPTWSAAMEWSRIVRAWGKDPLDVSPEEADVRVKQCELVLSRKDALTGQDGITLMRDHFKALVARREAREKLDPVLSNFLFDRVYLIEADEADGLMRYYAKSPPSSQSVSCLIGFGPTKIRLKFFAPGKYRHAMSPQSVQVNAFRKALDSDPTLANWDALMLEALKALAVDRKLDPIPKRLLMIEFARAGAQGSVTFRAGIEETVKLLKNPKIPEGMYWMDPEKDRECNPVREDVASIIDELRWDRVAEKIAASRADLIKSVESIPRPAGALLQEKQGDWRCTMSEMPAGGGRLLVILPGSKGATWAQVGSVKMGKATIAPTDQGLLVQGRLIFLANE